MRQPHSSGRYLSPFLLLPILLMQSVQAQVIEYKNITGTVTLVSASGPTPDSPLKLTYNDGSAWNLWCRESPVGTTSSASGGLRVDTSSSEVTISFRGETFAAPSPVVYTKVGGSGILVKASISQSSSESTGPSVVTQYTDSANFMFNTASIGREFTANVTEKQEYRRSGQLVATCIEQYRFVGYLTPRAPDPTKEFPIMDWVKGWIKSSVIDAGKSENVFKTVVSFGVRG